MARKGQRAPIKREAAPKTVKKQPQQQDRERISLQRSYLIAQMTTCFLISFFLLELFVRFGGQSFSVQQILSAVLRFDFTLIDRVLNIGVYLFFSLIFFLTAFFLLAVFFATQVSLSRLSTNSMTLYVNRLWKIALWLIAGLSAAFFALSVGQIVFTINEIRKLLDPNGPLYHFILDYGSIAIWAIIITQLLGTIIVAALNTFARLRNATPRLMGTISSIYSHLNNIATRLRSTTLSACSHLNGAMLALRNKISRIRIVRKKKQNRRLKGKVK